MHRLVAVAASFLLLAGCTDQATGPEDVPDPGSDPGTNETGPPPVVQPLPWDAVYYIDSGGLTTTPPAEGSVPLNGFIIPAATGNLDANEFHSDALPSVAHVPPQTVTATLIVTSDVPAAGNGAFDIAVWFGTTRGDSGFAFGTDGPLVPGEVKEFTFELDLSDHPGIVVPQGESWVVRVADSYEPEGAGQVHLLTGPEGSRVEFMAQNMTGDPFQAPEVSSDSYTGTAEGGAFIECPRDDHVERFTVDTNASWLDLQLAATNQAGDVDIDLDLYVGDEVVWHAGSPRDEEEILVAGPALEPYLGQELGVGVAICFGGHVDYEVTIAQG